MSCAGRAPATDTGELTTWELEKEFKVSPTITAVVNALHAELTVAFKTQAGQTKPVPFKAGAPQGDAISPVRSLEPLTIVQRTVEKLAPGMPPGYAISTSRLNFSNRRLQALNLYG